MYEDMENVFNNILDSISVGIKKNSKTEIKRHIKLERWLKNNFHLFENISEEKLKFFRDIFSDETVWADIHLKNEIVGRRLLEEKNCHNEVNPLGVADKFEVACKYCLIDKISDLFTQVFIKMQNGSPEVTRNVKQLKKNFEEQEKDILPVTAFWSAHIQESGGISEPEPIEGLKTALELNWGEGVVCFYNKVKGDKNIVNKEDILVDTIASTLSLTRGTCFDDENIIEFCLMNMSNEMKEKLSHREPNGFVCRAILIDLVRNYNYDAFMDLLKYLEPNDLSFKEYGCLISTLAAQLIKTPGLADDTKELLMFLWRHEKFEECRTCVFKDFPIIYALADLIEDLYIDFDNNEIKQEEILEILHYADEGQVEKVKKSLMMGMFYECNECSPEQNMSREELVEKIFSMLDKSVEQKEEKFRENDQEPSKLQGVLT